LILSAIFGRLSRLTNYSIFNRFASSGPEFSRDKFYSMLSSFYSMILSS